MTDYTVADTIYIMFTTRAFATGVPTVLAGTPVVSAYENDSATQITAGITLGVSHDSVVGMNLLTIVASGANGYEAGKDYNLVITTGTVGGVSVVGEVVGTFSLERSSAFTRLGAPAGASIAADLVVIDNFVDGLETTIGTAGDGLTNINLPDQTMNITGNLSGSVGSVTGAVGSVTGAVGSVTASVTIDATSVDLILDETLTSHVTADSLAVAVKDTLADTNELQSDDIPTTLATLATASALATVDTEVGNIQSDVTAILADTADIQPKIGTPAADLSADIAAVKVDTAATLVDTSTTIPAQLDSMSGTTFDTATDSLEALRNRGDSAWTTGAGGTPPQLLQNTTIATLASQTSFTLTAGSADDDAYNGAVVVVTDVSTSTQKAVGSVSDYTGSSKTVTLSADPGIFTMAAGDTIDIIANASTAPSAAAVRAEMDANSTQLAAIVADTNELQTDDVPGLIAGLNDPTAATIADSVWDEPLTGGSHNIATSAGRRLRTLQDFGVYEGGAVWVDEAGGTSTGTTDFEDATVSNRSNDFDNAQTVANSIGLTTIQIQNGDSITLTGALEGYTVIGNGATLALGSQNLGGTILRDFGAISGIGASTGGAVFFEDCLIGTSTISPSVITRSGLTATLTVGSAGAFRLVDCYSGVAGAAAPIVDLGAAVGATTMEFRRWSGGLTLNNVQAGDVISVDVVSGGTITVNGTGGTVVVRGTCNVVDGSGASVTITETSALNMTKINAEVDTAISDASLATASALATVDTVVDGIKLVTDALPDSGALTSLATAAALTTVDTVVDGIQTDLSNGTDGLGAIKADTANILTDTGTTIPSLLPAALVGGRMDSNVSAIGGNATSATNLSASALGIVPGACEGSPSTTVIQTDLAETTDDHYIGRVVIFTSGAAAGEASDITDYTGSTGTITVTAITTAPAAADTFVIV